MATAPITDYVEFADFVRENVRNTVQGVVAGVTLGDTLEFTTKNYDVSGQVRESKDASSCSVTVTMMLKVSPKQ